MSAKKIVTALSSIPGRGIIQDLQYEVVGETAQFYELKGVYGRVSKGNFTEEGFVIPNQGEAVVVKCNAKNPYKMITVGKEYEVSRTEREGKTDYYHIINDSKQPARYNIKFFTKPEKRSANVTKEVKKEPEIPKGMAKCIDPRNGLSADKLYKVVKKTANTIEITDDQGHPGHFLIKRFILG